MSLSLALKKHMEDKQFKLERVSGMSVSDDELLADLCATAKRIGKNTIGLRKYRQLGKYDDTTVSRRFGTWNKALQAAGLELSNEVSISDERLFENILVLWQYYGRQPRRRELAQEPSDISQSPYNRRFGSWSKTLEAFVEYANSTDTEASKSFEGEGGRRSTGRDPSLRLRWKVLQRDRFTCCACGSSPAITPGVELQVDHILPWSKGGETVLENLQTLCSICNLGKSNIEG